MATPQNNRATFFFTDGLYGWSETYWDTDAGDSLLETWNNAMALAQVRVPALAQGQNPNCTVIGNCNSVALLAVRVSSYLAGQKPITWWNNGLGQMVGANAPPGAPGGNGYCYTATAATSTRTNGGAAPLSLPTGSTAPSANPWDVINVRFMLKNGSECTRPFGGISSTALCDQSLNLTDTVWYPAFLELIDYLVSTSWGSLCSPIPEDGAQQITQWTTNPNGNPCFTVTTGFAAGICKQSQFRIWGYTPEKCTPRINGTFTAYPSMLTDTGGTSQLITTWCLRKCYPSLQPFCNGYVAPAAPVVSGFDYATSMRVARKKRGRPIGLPVGRSRAKC